MNRLRVLIADDNLRRLGRLKVQLASDDSFELMPPVSNLTDAYNLTELNQPDVVAVCEDLAMRPEFLMFGALLEALGLRCIIFGRANSRIARSCARAMFAVIDDAENADSIRGCIIGNRKAGLLAARVGASPCSGTRAVDTTFTRCVVIGASTGGIEALLNVLSSYPPNCPPTLIVQHIRAEFVSGLVQRLDRHCRAKVNEAREGAPLTTGQVYVAPEDKRHLAVRAGRTPYCRLVEGEPVSGHRPSVDVLFHSAAALGDGVVGVLLTGMGRDGAEGLLEIRRNGGRTIIQDKHTSTVYGMPRAAAELGAAMQELPLARIGSAIMSACRDSSAMAG